MKKIRLALLVVGFLLGFGFLQLQLGCQPSTPPSDAKQEPEKTELSRQEVLAAIDAVIADLNANKLTEDQAIEKLREVIPRPADFPKRNIEYIIGWGEGGGSDRYARNIGRDAEKILPVSFVYRNMPGAASEVAFSYVLSQPGDGHTIFGMVATNILNDAFGELPYSFVDQATFIISNQGPSEVFWVRKDSPFQTWDDLVKYAKENPGKLLLAAASPKSDDEFTYFQLQEQLGIQFRYVGFDGSGERQATLLGGHADLLLESAGPVIDLFRAGEIRPILYKGSIVFKEIDPTVPCSKDKGLDLDIIRFRGIVGPPNMPVAVRDYFFYVFYAASKMPFYQDYEKKAHLHYSQPWTLDPDTFKAFAVDYKKSAEEVIKAAYQ